MIIAKTSFMKVVTALFLFVSFFTKSLAQNTDSIPAKPKVAPWYTDRFRLSAGFFLPVTNTDLQVGVQGGYNGTPINLEKDLGVASTQLTFLANFQWRISRRSRLNLNYYNIPRKSTHTLDKDIIFKNDTFRVNSSVNTYFNTAIYQISYGYAILSKPNYELGILIGTHLVGGKAGIAVNGPNVGAEANTNFGFTAPLPDLGLWGGYTFSNRFAVNLDIDYLSLTIGDVTGSIFAYNLLFMYRAMPKLDISLGYSGLNFKVDLVKEHATGNFKWGYNGPALGVTYAFGKTSWGH
jgi:hypothetical protein